MGCFLFWRLTKFPSAPKISIYGKRGLASLLVKLSFNSDTGDLSCMDIEWFKGGNLISSQEDPDELEIFALDGISTSMKSKGYNTK